MPDNSPANSHPGYLSTEDVRNFMLDRSISDNVMSLDVFSDEDIQQAMQRTSRDYNSIPPFLGNVYGNRLPSSNIMFLLGVAKQVYLAQLQQLMRNDIDYTAGGVTTNLAAKKIEHYKYLIKELGAEFEQKVYQFKLRINIGRAFGRIG